MSRNLTFSEMAVGAYKFARYLTRGGLFNVNLELTKRCDARCSFCNYWKETPPPELPDYVPVIKILDPLSVSLTGGEPLLRTDLPDVITALRRNSRFIYIGLITNGSLLTLERGVRLWKAGLDELSISLDYLDKRHDQERGIPGLVDHVLSIAPELKAAGVALCFNVVVKRGNYQEVPGIVKTAASMGIMVSVSTYNCWRVNNDRHMIEENEIKNLEDMIEELKCLKKELGTLTTSDYYLDRIPLFFSRKGVPGCTAGINWVQITPDGMVKRCSDHPTAVHYSNWQRGFFESTPCDRCWYSCRGAAQEPWTCKRFLEMARLALS